MIEDTQCQLREARERLRASREALAASAAESDEDEAWTPAAHGNRWEPASPSALARRDPANRYIPDQLPEWLAAVLRRFPAWARPPAVGVCVMLLMTGLPILMTLPRVLGQPDEVREGLAVLLGTCAAGAAGGLAFSVLRPRVDHLGGVGDHLTGMACVAAYITAIYLVLPVKLTGRPGAAELILGLLFSVLVFGPVVGHFWFYAARKRDAGV